MNKILRKSRLAIYAAIACAFMAGCSENERPTYSIDNRIYFYETETNIAQEVEVYEKNFSFALQPSTLEQDTFKIAVRLMGRLADHDRMFRAVAVEDSTTAVSPEHYEILPGVLPANEYMGYLPVLLKRTADTRTHPVSVYLRLIDSEELTVGNTDALHFKLSWADMLLKPEHWPYYFGIYSTNKYRFAIDVLGITDWEQATRFSNGDEEGVYTAAQLQLMAAQLNEAYAEYRKTHGCIYVDDDADEKTEIYFSPNS